MPRAIAEYLLAVYLELVVDMVNICNFRYM